MRDSENEKIIASVIIVCTLALSVLSISSVSTKDNSAAGKVKRSTTNENGSKVL